MWHTKIANKGLILLSWAVLLMPLIGFAKLSINPNCHENFTGKVTSVTDLHTPFTSLKRVKVNFTLKDNNIKKEERTRTIKILKYGETTFEPGSSYLVKLRDNYICSVNKVKSI
ncbi:MAG: hypothetical protein HN353_08575 [Bdellovibrionales bacterium]|nr:hypothetical protein [Bdellovibrionales bacterium]MBT3526876.1 hypothetical protein [Bdellovibrionales bacterium]MBT7669699.1 hypothetical protein [Bdellovibrionales bacterium]MBT7765787.1 hypothetical protein [Bdellovibrionales bacterium]